MFDKILIANRGEIAVRVIRTCRKMGIATVAVYSDVDFRSLHVEASDESVHIGPPPPSESYLCKERIIETALSRGCQAIHPGYGFLSENPDFARMVTEAGLVFIGPSAETIARLGDKIAAKVLAMNVGAPVVSGHHRAVSNAEEATIIAESLGYPLLLKPAAGGGGRGMRIISSKSDIRDAFAACQDETRKGFADDRVFIERYIPRPRHIEVQIIGDKHGNIVYFPERECSVQRRYQKILEESPSAAVDDSIRRAMGDVACRLAQEAAYHNAGTVEFILDREGHFYFLEINTRLQVEHPVTEMVTSLDLVELQIRVAAGEALPVTQSDIQANGWAMEARVCAEDPRRDFLPTIGMITRYATPRGKGVRVDSGVSAGSLVTIYYDSLLAKVITHGQDREDAREKLVQSLNGFHLEGLTTNVDFVNAVINHSKFMAGDISTDFVNENFPNGKSTDEPSISKVHYMATAALLIYHVRKGLVIESLRPMAAKIGTKQVFGAAARYVIKGDKYLFRVRLEGNQSSRMWKITVDDASYEVETPEFEFYRRRLRLKIDGRYQMFRTRYQEQHIQVFFDGLVITFEIYSPREWELSSFMPVQAEAAFENVLRCPMPGLVTQVWVSPGKFVRKGEELLRIESMKMESGIAAPYDGEVERVLVTPGKTVDADEALLEFKSIAPANL
ncbi:MAG: acetyl-CoA carboxylase biotin carboxylase subunit [Desulfomonilaceae bacterium]